ncbi:MAG: prepilin-type N-terminal cleavage/methylation domain-containing protein [Lachnospiraceae bacterium]|nr:prepilin-type N-terminal cleavage/methylation domain-containing protein [Lachnospiraceae bacterium]
MRNSGSQRKRKLNNRGLSLVEVMVGIVILGIVTGPLLHSFVSALRYNQRAKERQRTTTAAQSIMEGFKAYDIEELCWQFSGDPAHPFRVIANSGVVSEEALSDRSGDGVPDTSILPQADGTLAFEPASDGHYAFVMQNISFESKLYDARVEVRPKAPLPDADFDGTQNMAAFEDINGYLDAIYKPQANRDQLAYTLILNKLLDKLNEEDASDEEFLLADLDTDKLRVEKETTVTIASPDAGICVVTVTTVYKYDARHYPYEDADGNEQELGFHGNLGVDDDDDSAVIYTEEIYNNTQTAADGAHLEKVYLYYYPAYRDVSGVKISSETIILQNNSGEAKDIYLIKQVNGTLSNVWLNNYENSYSPTVTGTGSAINLYHNLNTNLAGGGTTASVSISGVTEKTQLVENNPEYLLYEVIVSVYEEGAAANGFPAESCLLELNGSMNK